MIPVLILAIVAVAAGSVGITRMALAHREKMASLGSAPATNPLLEARLARMEEALDAIAVEVERMGEGQRFVTKLLAERSREPERAPGGTPRLSTTD
jgi:hypothetical protein